MFGPSGQTDLKVELKLDKQIILNCKWKQVLGNLNWSEIKLECACKTTHNKTEKKFWLAMQIKKLLSKHALKCCIMHKSIVIWAMAL